MKAKDPYKIMRAIAEMEPWERARAHNWALVPQMSEEPFIVSVIDERESKGPVSARILLFPGMNVFRDFMILRQMPDYGVAMTPMDVPHFEAVCMKKGKPELFVYEPGYVPRVPTEEELDLFSLLLNECHGFMLRLEENPDLPLEYVKQKAMFARKEVVDGVWVDGPVHVDDEGVIQQTECIALAKSSCAKAKGLPVFPKEIWQVDFVLLPMYHTHDERSRFLYLFVAVNAENGDKMVWERMSVDGKKDGLKRLWEGCAQKLLDGIVKWGRVPGEIHVNNARMMRFMRPLGMQLPFKLVQHSKLPALESEINLAIKTNKV